MPRPNRARSIGGEANLAERIKYEREAEGWSPAQLAKAMTEAGCSISTSAIYKVEAGERTIKVDELIALSQVFDLTVENLLTPMAVLKQEWAEQRLRDGSATVEASGSATVTASDSATVRATPWVAIHLHSACATVTGGHIIDVAALDLTDPATWCAYHGVPITDGVATLCKAVNDTWTTDRGVDYSPGSTPEAADWRDDHQCGGGLHFSPTPMQARSYYHEATRYVAVGVRLDELSPIPGGTPKAKARRVVVACREVTIDAEAVE